MDIRGSGAGISTRRMANERRQRALWWLFPFLFLSIIVLSILYFFRDHSASNWIVLAVGITVIGVWKVADRRTDHWLRLFRNARQGAIAEEHIGTLLAGLGPDYRVMHDLPTRYGNIDHLVISREHGLFVIETKSHRGRVQLTAEKLTVSGRPAEKNFAAQVQNNVTWVKQRLLDHYGIDIWVNAVLVFDRAYVTPMGWWKGMLVVNSKYLIEQLTHSPKRAVDPRLWIIRSELLEVLATETTPVSQHR